MSYQFVKLGDACEVKRGTTITEKQAIAGDVPVIAGGLTYSYKHNVANRNGNVITVSGSGANAGYVNFWSKPIFASDCSTIQSLSNNVDIKYAYYFLKSKQFFINSTLRSGAAQPHVYAKDIAQLMMPLPSLAEQKRITAILDKATEIKTKREQAIAKLDELAQSTFVEMFGDPVVNPKNLKKQKLTEFFKFKTGKLDSNAAIENGKYPFFTCSKDNFLINEFAFDEEALLLAGNNANGDYSVKYYSGRFNAYQRTYVINLANSDNTYEYAKSSLEFMLAQMKRRSKGTSTKYLTMSLFDEMTILVPSKSLQEKYGQIIKKIEDLKRKELIKSAVISNLICSLQHQAFTKGLNA